MDAKELVESGVEAVIAPDAEVFVKGITEPAGPYPPVESLGNVLAGQMLAQGRNGVVYLYPIQFFRAFESVDQFQFAVPGFREHQEVGAGSLVHRPSVPKPDVDFGKLWRFASDKEI